MNELQRQDERRVDRRRDDVRFERVDQRLGELEQGLKQNNEMTAKVEKNTSDIVEAWRAISGGLKVLGWLGTAAKFLSYFAMAVSAVGGAWYAVTHWGAPPAGPK